jgi:transposase
LSASRRNWNARAPPINRKLTANEEEALRRRVVARVREGERPEKFARLLDINVRTLYRWLERFQYGGKEAALHNKPKSGRPPMLDGAKLQWLAREVCAHHPLQLNFPLALQILGMIRELTGSRATTG